MKTSPSLFIKNLAVCMAIFFDRTVFLSLFLFFLSLSISVESSDIEIYEYYEPHQVIVGEDVVFSVYVRNNVEQKLTSVKLIKEIPVDAKFVPPVENYNYKENVTKNKKEVVVDLGTLDPLKTILLDDFNGGSKSGWLAINNAKDLVINENNQLQATDIPIANGSTWYFKKTIIKQDYECFVGAYDKGSLTFDQEIVASDGNINDNWFPLQDDWKLGDVILKGDKNPELYFEYNVSSKNNKYPCSYPPLKTSVKYSGIKNYEIEFLESGVGSTPAGQWSKYDCNSKKRVNNVTQKEMLDVLASLNEIRIRGEFIGNNTEDKSAIDNVKIMGSGSAAVYIKLKATAANFDGLLESKTRIEYMKDNKTYTINFSPISQVKVLAPDLDIEPWVTKKPDIQLPFQPRPYSTEDIWIKDGNKQPSIMDKFIYAKDNDPIVGSKDYIIYAEIENIGTYPAKDVKVDFYITDTIGTYNLDQNNDGVISSWELQSSPYKCITGNGPNDLKPQFLNSSYVKMQDKNGILPQLNPKEKAIAYVKWTPGYGIDQSCVAVALGCQNEPKTKNNITQENLNIIEVFSLAKIYKKNPESLKYKFGVQKPAFSPDNTSKGMFVQLDIEKQPQNYFPEDWDVVIEPSVIHFKPEEIFREALLIVTISPHAKIGTRGQITVSCTSVGKEDPVTGFSTVIEVKEPPVSLLFKNINERLINLENNVSKIDKTIKNLQKIFENQAIIEKK